LDGSLERILYPEDLNERILSVKESDSPAKMTGKPKPSYTKEARRIGIQGFVTLKVLLSANGKIARVRVVKGLRAGLTENAIGAACRIEFKPATKDGQPVSQRVIAEYVFRLANSSIFAPYPVPHSGELTLAHLTLANANLYIALAVSSE
jgi:TonB family protein